MTHHQKPRRILLVGAGYTAQIVAAELVRHARGEELVGALDDDPAKAGVAIATGRVLGSLDELEQIVAANDVDEVVIAIPSATGARLRTLVAACRRAAVPVRTMPGILELLGKPITRHQLRPVEVGDLLRRAETRCDEPPAMYLAGARLLITGAGGSIGAELARQVARAPLASLILLGHGENSIHEIHSEIAASVPAFRLHPIIADIRDRQTIDRVLHGHRISVVFHAAAHKHVPLMEAHVAEAVRNNILGTDNVVRAAASAGVERFVFISTDKAVSPISVMGATKRICEWIVRDAASAPGTRYMTVRFGNVLGSRGSVVPFFRRQLEQGGPLTITHPEMTRFFMTIQEAVYLVLKAGGEALGGELFVLNMGEPVRIADLAADLVRLSGFEAHDVAIVHAGLRPGEKLHEALWEEGSTVEAVGDGDVFRVVEAVSPPSGLTLRSIVETLVDSAGRDETRHLRRLLSEAIPTFRSSVS